MWGRVFIFRNVRLLRQPSSSSLSVCLFAVIKTSKHIETPSPDMQDSPTPSDTVYLDVQDDNSTSVRRFRCLRKAARMSGFLAGMLEHFDEPTEEIPVLPLPRKHCSPYAVEQIVKWCEYHCDDPNTNASGETVNRSFDEGDDTTAGDVPAASEISCYWDRNFMHSIASPSGLTPETRANLYDLLIASHFLVIDRLTDLGAKFLCKLIAGKSCDEVRSLLNIANDFEPNDERAVHEQNAWFDKRNL